MRSRSCRSVSFAGVIFRKSEIPCTNPTSRSQTPPVLNSRFPHLSVINPFYIIEGQEQLCGTTCTEIGRETSSEFVSRNLEWGSHPANRKTETSLRIGNILSAKRVTWVGEPVPFVAKQAGFPRSGV